MLICLRGCNCNGPFLSSEESSSETVHARRVFTGTCFSRGAALAFTQLLLCPSICTSLSEEEIQSSTLKFNVDLSVIK